jgi:zinc transporter, ZIP family
MMLELCRGFDPISGVHRHHRHLAISIGLQNVPEGLAIALPLRRGGMTHGRAFFWDQLSGAIEPLAGGHRRRAWAGLIRVLAQREAATAGAMLYVS